MTEYNKLGIEIHLVNGEVETIDPIEGLLDEDDCLIVQGSGNIFSTCRYSFPWKDIKKTELYRMSERYSDND